MDNLTFSHDACMVITIERVQCALAFVKISVPVWAYCFYELNPYFPGWGSFGYFLYLCCVIHSFILQSLQMI